MPSLSNEDFHTLQSPKISFPINHNTKNTHFQENKISNDFDEIKNKTTVFQERFCQNNQTNYNPTEFRRPPVDGFIDQLIEGKRTVWDTSSTSFTVPDIFKQELESRHLTPIDLLRFSGNPGEWPEFIENFFSQFHQKSSFDDNLRMPVLISVLDGEAKRLIAAIDSNSIFYTTTLKTLKKNFGDPLLIAHLKIKAVFDRPQIKPNDRIGQRNFHQHLKICNSWLCSISYEAPLLSSKNIAKELICLPHNIRNDFYKATKKSNFVDGRVDLIVLERWLDSRVQNYFKPLANIVASHEKQKINNERNNKFNVN